MSEVFVVKNQLGQYWGKGKAWEDGTEPRTIMRFKHEDEAINTLFELSSKDIELRGDIQSVSLSDKGNPVVEPSEHLIPREPKVAKTVSNATQSSDAPEAAPASAVDTGTAGDGGSRDTADDTSQALES